MTDARGRRQSGGRLRSLYHDALAGAPPPPEGTICAVPIPDSEANRLGRTREGFVCLVISAKEGSGVARPDVRLQNLQVQRRMLCEVTRPSGERESLTGVVVTCSADSGDLRGFFLDLFDQALDALGGAPAERDIDAWIDHAARLFSDLESTAFREIRGLWGELFVIAESKDPSVLVRRWHEDPADRFDFSAGAFALEVKTCKDLERVHVFSLPQLRPSTVTDVVVASVPTVADAQGSSAVDLLAEITQRVPDAAVCEKLRETAFRVGRSSLLESHSRFDVRIARGGLRLMRASNIPAFEERPPSDVLEVTLSVRCRDVPGEDLADWIEAQLRG